MGISKLIKYALKTKKKTSHKKLRRILKQYIKLSTNTCSSPINSEISSLGDIINDVNLNSEYNRENNNGDCDAIISFGNAELSMGSNFLPDNFAEMVSRSSNNSVRKYLLTKNSVSLTTAPSYVPADIVTAYNIPRGGNYGGLGMKIGIVGAYKSKSLQKDLNTFCNTYNLPLTKLIMHTYGKTYNSGWEMEACLDTQWAHAIAPQAEIHVFESYSATTNDVFYAINEAAKICDIVSMSLGQDDRISPPGRSDPLNLYPRNSSVVTQCNQTQLDKIFNKYPNVCFIASSGDSSTVCYPSSSPYVVAVGGTTIQCLTDICGTRAEYSWEGAGAGISCEPKPSYQSIINSQTRVTPDISLIANPLTGVMICYGGKFYTVGGTSASAPIFAGICAILNTPNVKFSSHASSKYCIQTILYNIYNSNQYTHIFNDIKIGVNGEYATSTGYDCTGIGSINVSNLLDYLKNNSII